MNRYLFVVLFWTITLCSLGGDLPGERPLQEEDARKEVETFKETLKDPTLNEEELVVMRQRLEQQLGVGDQTSLEKELLQQKISAVDDELQRRVLALPPQEVPEPIPVEHVDIGSHATVEQLGDALGSLVKDIDRNGSRIVSVLDTLGQRLKELPKVTDVDSQAQQYDELSRLNSTLNDARRAIEIGGKTLGFDAKFIDVERQVNQHQTSLLNSMLNDQIRQVRDSRLSSGPQTVWRRVLDGLKSAFSFVKNGFRSSATLVRDLGRASDFVKQLQAVAREAQKNVDTLYAMYTKEIAKTKLFLEKDISTLSAGELLNVREQLSGLLNTNKFYAEQAQKEVAVFKESFDEQTRGLMSAANGVIGSLNARVLVKGSDGQPKYESLYEQFNNEYVNALKLEKTGYAFKQEQGKGWVPDALGFRSYSALLEAPFEDIDARWKTANLPENRDKPGWAVARELHIILSDPISRENFRSYLDAQGLIDAYPKGPEIVNSLVLPDSVFGSLASFTGNVSVLSADMIGRINFSLPDLGITQKEIQQKIAEIDKRLGQLGQAPTTGISIQR